jgi:hypothetical protein
MQHQVRQLMTERGVEITLVGAKQDRARSRHSHANAPGWSSAGGKGVQATTVWNDDEPERTKVPLAQARPVGRISGALGKLAGELELAWPGYRGYLTYSDGHWLVLLGHQPPPEGERR